MSEVSDYWSKNGIEEYSGEKECNHPDGCHKTADWEIELIDKNGSKGLRRSCDDHIQDLIGYRPI